MLNLYIRFTNKNNIFLFKFKPITQGSIRLQIENINNIAKTQLTDANVNQFRFLLPTRRAPNLPRNSQTRSHRLEQAAMESIPTSSHQNLTLSPVKPTFDNSVMKTHKKLPSYPVTPSLYMAGGS